MPREWGGPELDPMSQLGILEAFSIADASVGWCAMIGDNA
jgi:alkylation response protein AidB-like acyl-CoA dehydrogenase